MFLKRFSIVCSLIVLNLFTVKVLSQVSDDPLLTIKSPAKPISLVSSAKNFITGITCNTCLIKINEQPVKVFSTGTFALQVNLFEGDSLFTITSTKPDGKTTSKEISYSFKPPLPADTVKDLTIATIQTFPAGDLLLKAGDKIKFRVKALPASTVTTFNNTILYELPSSQTGGMPGIYQGEYEVRSNDNFSNLKMPVTLLNNGARISKETVNRMSVMSPLASDVAITTGRLAHLKYGLGEDRLGGAKIGYLDSLIPLKIIGKVGINYKVQLAKNRTAFIEEELVRLLPKGSFTPESLSTNWRVFGDSAFDYVQISLSNRLPYQSMQLLDPSMIVVDIFGATNNTNWITQLESAKEITHIDYEQLADDIFRVRIRLKNTQHWGHQIYYAGNILVIKIKQQPKSLQLKDLKIAVDAGHGGSNTGAQGLTGIIEKELALAISLKVQDLLVKEGAKVLMTRTTETFVDNKDRILLYRDNKPDLLVSIHFNSAVDPINASGTMMFYRYAGFKSLSDAIYKRMIELPLKPGGVTGSFNFMLNSPTEYPNALVETLFISNLEEEAKILDPLFQQRVAEKIVAGIKDFLVQASKK